MMNLNKSSTLKSLLLIGPPETGKRSSLTTLFSDQNPLFIDLEDWSLLNEILKKPQVFQDILNTLGPQEYLTIHRLDRIYKYLPLLLKAMAEKNIMVAATVGYLPENFEMFQLQQFFDFRFFGGLDFFQTQNGLVLLEALSYGALPYVYNSDKPAEKIKYLKTYTQNFLDVEIFSHDKIRNLVPFHLFLPLAVRHVGKNLNFSWLSQNLNVNYKTIQHYFDLFVQHGVGFYLPSFPQQLRKVQLKASRFYFFDVGFQRALAENLDHPLYEYSEEYDSVFKSWIIIHIHTLIQKYHLPMKMYYLETKDGVGIELILEPLSGPLKLINFTTSRQILPKHLKSLKKFEQSLPGADLIVITPNNYKDFFNQIFRTALDDMKVQF